VRAEANEKEEEMSTVNLIAVETGLLLSAMAFAAWVNHAAHRAAMV